MDSVLENTIYHNQQVPQSVIVLTKIMPDVSDSVLTPILKSILTL